MCKSPGMGTKTVFMITAAVLKCKFTVFKVGLIAEAKVSIGYKLFFSGPTNLYGVHVRPSTLSPMSTTYSLFFFLSNSAPFFCLTNK